MYIPVKLDGISTKVFRSGLLGIAVDLPSCDEREDDTRLLILASQKEAASLRRAQKRQKLDYNASLRKTCAFKVGETAYRHSLVQEDR